MPSPFSDAPPPPDPFQPTTGLASLWEATRPAAPTTELVRDPDDYLGTGRRDIGRQIGDNLRELFVSCDPAPAMLQQFELLHPDYVAVHDIGTASSRRLLAAVAAASRRAVQRLVIRRQGYGTPLATLEFVEFDDADARLPPLRLYSTETDADTASRHNLARVLLAHSRLAVIMVGDLPAHALAQALQPLQGDIAAGQWRNGHLLLLLPLASPAALANLGNQLGRGGSRSGNVVVRTTPQISKPAEAWNFVSATWNRLREQLAAQGIALPGLPMASGAPAAAAAVRLPDDLQSGAVSAWTPLASAPTVPAPFASTSVDSLAPEGDPLHDYARRLLQVNGVVAGCVFEAASGRVLAHAGSMHRAADLAREGVALLAMLLACEDRLAPERGSAAHAGDTLPEAAITLARHHLIVRPLHGRPGLAVHAVLDRSRVNLTLARLQIARLDATPGGDAAEEQSH